MFAKKYNQDEEANFFRSFHILRKSIPILLCCVIGAIIIWPSLQFRYSDEHYAGIELFGADAEDGYLAQIQEVYDGHWAFGQVYFADGKQNPFIQQPLLPVMIASMGKVFGLSARGINLLSKFLFPALLTLVLYMLFYAITGRKDVALLMSTFIMMAPATTALLNPGSWQTFLKNGQFLNTETQFLSYSRPINPQASSLFFYGYLLVLWKFLYDPMGKRRELLFGIGSILLLGLSFYTYFFVFSLLFSFTFILGAWYLFTADNDLLKKISVVLAGSLVFGIYYFWNFIAAAHSPWYLDTTRRLGFFESHAMVFSRIWLGVFIASLLCFRPFTRRTVFLLCFWVAAFTVSNQQLITGRMVPVQSHYHWYYIAPIGGAILLYILFMYLPRFVSAMTIRFSAAALIVFFLFAGILFQKNSYVARYREFEKEQRYAPVLQRLDREIPQESTIFSDRSFMDLVPGYTHHDVYSMRYAGDFLGSKERLQHTLFIFLRLDGVSSSQAAAFFAQQDNKDLIGSAIFGQYYRMKNGCYGCFPDLVLNSLINDYRLFLTKDFVTELKAHPVDYIVWDKKNDLSWALNRYFHNKLFEANDFIVYKI